MSLDDAVEHADCRTRLSTSMIQTSAMLSRLNHETRPHHTRADAPWLALASAEIRRQDYIRQLVLAYGFEAPLEAALAYTKGLGTVVRLSERTRAGLLVQDLLALGHEPAQLSQLPQCFSITPFNDVAEGLGWLYVVERWTLLHDSVRRNLLQRLPDARRASSYLAAAGSIAGTRWRAFGAALDRLAVTAAIQQRIVEAATHAMQRWQDWQDWLRDNHPEHRSTG